MALMHDVGACATALVEGNVTVEEAIAACTVSV
jgi:hypothetical protein